MFQRTLLHNRYMKSTSTRVAAGVLAITIPLAPTSAYALERAHHSPTSARMDATIATSQRLATSQRTKVSESNRIAIASAIDSARSAAMQTITAIGRALNATEFDRVTAREDLAFASVALEAARAELSHSTTLLPPGESPLRTALEAISSDLTILRNGLPA